MDEIAIANHITLKKALTPLIGSMTPVALKPVRFFVAWNGVLTLAFAGFPSAMVDLKNAVGDALGLMPENPGSKWPKVQALLSRDFLAKGSKVTLAALTNGSEPLTLQELEVLQRVCLSCSDALLIGTPPFCIRRLTLTTFGCRSVEKVLQRTDMATMEGREMDSSVSAEQAAYVLGVLAEGNDAGAYLENVRKEGNRIRYVNFNHS
ncbi:hypothetical protein HK101_010437 [Irineochytrium annulatum]|nr:hypothetical protein HK101_010437 [Irineochytrium annulatum]